MYLALLVILLLALLIMILLSQPQFGKLPTGERLQTILRSPNYKDGSFRNQSITPDLTEGATYFSVLTEFFFSRRPRLKPEGPVPSVKTDLLNPYATKTYWYGLVTPLILCR